MATGEAPSRSELAAGGAASYHVTLTNPGDAAETYSLTLGGLPQEWVALPPTASVAARSSVTLTAVISVPESAAADAFAFAVVAAAATSSALAGAHLSVVDSLDLSIVPVEAIAHPGTTVVYSVTVRNLRPIAQEVTLEVEGTPGGDVVLPSPTVIAAEGALTLPLHVTAHATRGIYPFTVRARSEDGAAAARAPCCAC